MWFSVAPKMDTKKTRFFKKIRQCAQNLISILGLIIQHNVYVCMATIIEMSCPHVNIQVLEMDNALLFLNI